MERDKHDMKELLRSVEVIEKLNFDILSMLKRMVTILEKLDNAVEEKHQ